MASYAKMQDKLTKAIRSRKHNTRPARIYALLDAGIEPDADGIARLVVFYRASGLQDCHKSRILQHRQAILRRFVESGYIDPAGIADESTGDT